MKKKKQNSNPPSKTAQNVKKASYIGALLVVVISSLSVILATKLPDKTFSSLQAPATPVPLPPTSGIASSTPTLPSKPMLPSPSPVVTPETTETVLPVTAEPETLQIILPCEGDVIIPFTGEQLTYSKTLEDWRAHAGIDIATPPETPVCAAADGTIEQVYQDSQMGHTIIVRHGELYQTVYQNLLNTDAVTPGQTVKAGQQIGAVGHSAPAELKEDSHLHFAVLAGQIFQNPLDFLIHP